MAEAWLFELYLPLADKAEVTRQLRELVQTWFEEQLEMNDSDEDAIPAVDDSR